MALRVDRRCWPRLWLLVGLLAGCCQRPAAPTRGALAGPPPCSQRQLAIFDPGLEVRRRTELPPARQQLGESTDQVVVVACERGQALTECRAGAEQQVRRAFPRASSLRSELVATEVELVVQLWRDGRTDRRRFDDVAALAQYLRRSAAAGRAVTLQGIEAVAAPDAPHSAVVIATVPGPRERRTGLRTELLLAPPTDAARAMRTLQARAARVGVQVHAVDPQPSGALRVEIGCVRRGE